MKIVFRLNYYTVPGESLWVRLTTFVDGDDASVEQVMPLRWINSQQWEGECEVKAKRHVRIAYHYQYRKEGHGLELDEWGDARVVEMNARQQNVMWIRDTWRSAGTVDYAFETKAFQSTLPARGPFVSPVVPPRANHAFRLHCAAVPRGHALCLIGGIPELGAWDLSRAIPMQELSANQWELNVRIPNAQAFEYKYGLYDQKTKTAVQLETGENRLMESHALSERQQSLVHDEGYRRHAGGLYRAAGVAVPVFSLRSERSLGVGEFADLKPLADWSQQVGLELIQILPVNDTTSSHDWTDSYPYSAISVFALHPLYLRVDDLPYPMPRDFAAEIEETRQQLNGLKQVDYEAVMKAKMTFARRIYQKHLPKIQKDKGLLGFFTTHRDWLLPYAAFCLLRDQFGTADFSRWDESAVYEQSKVQALIALESPSRDEMFYHIWLQYELHQQLVDATAHLHACGVSLKGDLPIGIDRESVDAWVAPDQFKMHAQAGAPPDAFSEKGQNWGFPTYDWDVMAADGYAWWRARFDHLSQYFDAFRIDHILGFFRIWQVPAEQVEGIMGWFDPAMPVHVDEFRERKIPFDADRFCQPYIPERVLEDRFGEFADEVMDQYLVRQKSGLYRLREEVSNQRKIVDHFAALESIDSKKAALIRQGLLDCVSDVLFFEVPGSNGTEFHPRFFIHKTTSFADLDVRTQERVDALYVDYFFRRQDDYWQACGCRKLPAMRRASTMLLCGEDLGMVPDCVPGVLRELGILSLEIQRMPKSLDLAFSDPAKAPYLSVVSPSTHDMSTLRVWWTEDPQMTRRFAWQQLGEAYPPDELTPLFAEKILRQHLESPAMWVVVPLQDLLSIDASLRHSDPHAERINVPAVMPYYWRYRMHLPLEQLIAAEPFNRRLAGLLADGQRVIAGEA